ncbi:MAG: metallophosphoesterase [Planctomycetes bacterium]|nr:metallophosphoesterase [Planctomycetota bacterium]
MNRRAPLERALVLVAMLIVLLGGCTATRGFDFDITADMRGFTPPEYPGPQHFLGVCQAIRELGPGAFMITPGDADPPDRVRLALDQVFGPAYLWYPVVGNHELDKPEHMDYLRAYNAGGAKLPGIVHKGPPAVEETCYSFDYHNAHFVVLNQYYDGQSDAATDGDSSPALLAWLADDLAANRRPYTFVLGHEPVLSVPDLDNGRVRHRGDSLDKYADNNHRFWTLLRAHDVVAYFCGHTHNASLTRINGVWQIDCGHSRGLGDPGAPSTFLKVYVQPDGVRCALYRDDARGGRYELVYEERLR